MREAVGIREVNELPSIKACKSIISANPQKSGRIPHDSIDTVVGEALFSRKSVNGELGRGRRTTTTGHGQQPDTCQHHA